MCVSQLFFCKQAIVFISDSLQSVIYVDADVYKLVLGKDDYT